uniref:Uncharacterized protein n=1 Tax=Oryza barthii TaxID=65489 RepID=A0A0D3FFP4_9ORYZ
MRPQLCVQLPLPPPPVDPADPRAACSSSTTSGRSSRAAPRISHGNRLPRPREASHPSRATEQAMRDEAPGARLELDGWVAWWALPPRLMR